MEETVKTLRRLEEFCRVLHAYVLGRGISCVIVASSAVVNDKIEFFLVVLHQDKERIRVITIPSAFAFDLGTDRVMEKIKDSIFEIADKNFGAFTSDAESSKKLFDPEKGLFILEKDFSDWKVDPSSLTDLGKIKVGLFKNLKTKEEVLMQIVDV